MAAFRSQPGQTRESRFGLAVALLAQQPKTDGAINASRKLCSDLVDEDVSDKWGHRARYLLARIAEFHLLRPDTATALRQYEMLMREAEGEEIAETARVRYTILRLYAPVDAAEFKARFDEAERVAETMKFAPARRDMHLALGDVASFRELALEVRLKHALAAYEAGIVQPARRGTVLIRIGELSRKLGQVDQALKFYRLYLAQPTLDNRAQLVVERISSLDVTTRP